MGSVIKGFGRVVPGVVLDAHAEAEELRRTARTELAQVRAKLTAERERARSEGLIEGRAQGVAELATIRAGARERTERELDVSVPAAITLGRKMAEMIVGRAIALSPETVADIAAAALASCRPTASTVTVRVHPDDVASATTRRDLLLARVPAAAELRLVADESVARHGCIVETTEGQVDARLETQLDALERALIEGARG